MCEQHNMIAILDEGENDDWILSFNTYNNLSYYEVLQLKACQIMWTFWYGIVLAKVCKWSGWILGTIFTEGQNFLTKFIFSHGRTYRCDISNS